MTTFYLVEHGEADYDLAEGRRLRGHGWDLVPLTARGVEQIEATAATLRGLGIEVLLSSPMTRALQSASIIGRRLGLAVIVELDLREWSPDLTGSYDTVAVVRAAGDEYARHGGEWPEGETRAWEPRSMLLERVRGVLRRYAHVERAIVVCHGYVIHALTGQTAIHGGVYELRERP
jgi:broad specificity phosphatase PhoE